MRWKAKAGRNGLAMPPGSNAKPLSVTTLSFSLTHMLILVSVKFVHTQAV